MAALTEQRHPSRVRRLAVGLVPVALVLVGILVLLYPVGATLYNNHRQAQFAEKYLRDVEQIAPAERSKALEQARAYNAILAGVPILDPWLTDVVDSSPEYREYEQVLNGADVMARVRVPAIGVNLPLRHGTGDDVLARGLGHLYGTALPVGGVNTHSVITGHTGMASATMLDRLVEVGEGEMVYVDVLGETLAYRVDQIRVVLPDQAEELERIDGRDLLTLITCTPYGSNSHRLLVRGERVPYVTAADEQPGGLTPGGLQILPWMWGTLALVLVALVVAAVIVAREARGRSKAAD